MSKNEKSYSSVSKCGHCNNRAPMEIVCTYSQVQTDEDPEADVYWEAGEVYQLLLCPACNDVMLQSFYYHEMMDEDEVEIKVLYPSNNKIPVGLPDTIKRAYDAALRVRTIDANAYAVLIGRVLEMVCEDRKATGKTLNLKLSDLASKGEIPNKLVGVASHLRNLRNVGAHATLGELTNAEIPILDDLCKAILEYVYSAPFLAEQAEERLNNLKAKRSK